MAYIILLPQLLCKLMACCYSCNTPVSQVHVLLCGHIFCDYCAELAGNYLHICPVCESTYIEADLLLVDMQEYPGDKVEKSCRLHELYKQWQKALDSKASSPHKMVYALFNSSTRIILCRNHTYVGYNTHYHVESSVQYYDNFILAHFRYKRVKELYYGCICYGYIYSGYDDWSDVIFDGRCVVARPSRTIYEKQTEYALPFCAIASVVRQLETEIICYNYQLSERLQGDAQYKYVDSFAGKILMGSSKIQPGSFFKTGAKVTVRNFQPLRSVVLLIKPYLRGILAYALPDGCCYVCFHGKRVGMYKIGKDGQHELAYRNSLCYDISEREWHKYYVPLLYYGGNSILPVTIDYKENPAISKLYTGQLGLVCQFTRPDSFVLVKNPECMNDSFCECVQGFTVKCNPGCQTLLLHTDMVTRERLKQGARVAASINYAIYTQRQFGRIIGSFGDYALVKWETSDKPRAEFVQVANEFVSELVYV